MRCHDLHLAHFIHFLLLRFEFNDGQTMAFICPPDSPAEVLVRLCAPVLFPLSVIMFPYLDGVVDASASDVFATWREADTGHIMLMSFEPDNVFRGQVDNAQCMRIRPDNDLRRMSPRPITRPRAIILRP